MNTITRIARYFQFDTKKPMTSAEFMVFWRSLTPEEKEEWVKADLGQEKDE